MPLSLEDRRTRLAGFLELNPKASVENHPRDNDAAAIFKPWDDDSLIIDVPDVGADDFVRRLNIAFLPERFSAVYHSDINAIEFVYGVYPNEDVVNRKFTFIDGENNYTCEFSDASDLLRGLAKHFYPTAISMNEHRNLFNIYANEQKKTNILLGQKYFVG